MDSLDSNDLFDAKVLMAKGKRATAAYILNDCTQSPWPVHLNAVLDCLLNPARTIDEWDTIDWCKWLMAGGRTPDEFATIVRAYDNATTCGLVWTPNFVAYRCRTCGISPCMSLCTECFKKGNHQGHDFNMFLSQAGGACDCGDTSVMKESGFCDKHGPNKATKKGKPPKELLCVAEAMMPRIVFRLIMHLREHCSLSSIEDQRLSIQQADGFIGMLLDFNNMGALMRRVMTKALTCPEIYDELNDYVDKSDTDLNTYLFESHKVYKRALLSFPNPEPIAEFRAVPPLAENLVHRSFLDELVFWTVIFEFPQRVVCLLLNMLPDPDYKEALTRAFVLHYSRIAMMLERSNDPDTLSNRVVHVSVQLFSNEGLALQMTEELNLLHVMVVSLRYMMNKIRIRNTLHDTDTNFHYVVDCDKPVMSKHCYWPLVSDLNNVLSHRPVALKFMADNRLLEMWFEFLSMFQGMNVNQREMVEHVKREPQTYYASFSAELEASAYPMWALVSHLVDGSTAALTLRVIKICLSEIAEWLASINFTGPNMTDNLQVSFHLPLHRYFSIFLCQAVAKQGINLDDVLPTKEVLMLMMMHPLRVQVAFYEILNGLWVRNGLQIKGQAMTYIQCNFSNSMVDADLYLLQISCTRLKANDFMNTIIDRFHIAEWMSLTPFRSPENPLLNTEKASLMLESFLTFLATLVTVRTNIGLTESELNRLEMVTLLCMGDKTHSQLMELMPERCGTAQSRNFEGLLDEVADYRPPALEASGNLQQGMYSPKPHVWEKHYDPIHVLLRAVHRKDFQNSKDRYSEYARLRKPGVIPWPPFRTPADCAAAYEDPRHILRSRVFHAAAFVILHKAVRGQVSEHVMSLIIFLLEQALIVGDKPPWPPTPTAGDESGASSRMCLGTSGAPPPRRLNDMDLENWFTSDSLLENLPVCINKIVLAPEPEISPLTYSSDSDLEWENSEADTEMAEFNLMLDNSEWYQSAGGLVSVYGQQTPENETSRQQQAIGASALLALPPAPSTDNSSDDQDQGGTTDMEVDVNPMAVALPSYGGDTSMVTSVAEESYHQHQPGYLALTAGNEVGRTAAIGWSGASSSSTANQGQELVPSTSGGYQQQQQQQHHHHHHHHPHHHHHRKNYPMRRRPPLEGANQSPPTVRLDESLISLLLKLHSQLSGVPDSFKFDEEMEEEQATGAATLEERNLIGDGAHCIGRLLKKMAQLDGHCKRTIDKVRTNLWPIKEERHDAKEQQEDKEKEQRRRRAKERQQKLMAEFASKQKEFMEKAMETDANAFASGSSDEEILVSKQEYDCVICSQSTPSTEDKPMGLVVLVQATSVIGHRRRYGQPARSVLPTCDEDREQLRRDDTLASEFDRRLEELDRHFDPKSWYLSMNLGWDGGVHVQTCGHHLHLDCLNSYLHSLRSQQRMEMNISLEKGEYSCPLCRQIANSVLPLAPQLGDCAQMVRSKPSVMSEVLDELSEFLRENDQRPSSSNLAEAIGKVMEVMTTCTQLKPMFKPKSDKPIPQSLFLFVTSIARTNLEVELIQRGGTLVNDPSEPPNPLLPKRDCIVPLLHVLSVHARVARVLAMWPVWLTFQQLCGLPPKPPGDTALSPIENEVPLLLKDPIALLLQFVLLLPLHLDQTYFSTTVQMVYNLLYYQVVAQVSCGLTGAERTRAAAGANENQINSLADALGLINKCLGHTDLYMEDDGAGCSRKPQINLVALEQQVQKLCLPYLRIAALLKYHIYQQPLPDIRNPESEFVRLVYYLELVTESMDWESFNSAVALNWPSETQMQLSSPTSWCNQYAVFVGKSQIAARSFLVDQHITWHLPKLLQLPREYEKIFTYYHERPCSQCQSVPQETSICLLCGTIVCLKQPCCKQQNIFEATQHAAECGAGTGIFLVVTSTYIIVIRGHRACLWGSLYLDDFEEEDRDLKRGKPLYLSKDRYQLLEQQWLAHRFDHTKKTWVHHRNAL